jgi:hypothetical protein
MNRIFLALYFLTAMALPSWSVAQDSAATYDQYQATRNLAVKLFIAAYTSFGNRLRAFAVLQACNKTGVAKAIDVLPEEGVTLMLAEIKRLRLNDSKSATILNTLTTTETINLISSVNDQLIAYKLGYKEAVGVLQDRNPAICEAGMQSADKLLKERK